MKSIIIPSKIESEFIEIPHYVSGMGKINTVCAVYDLHKLGARDIILSGFCGGIKGYSVGDIVRPSTIIEGDYSNPFEPYPNRIEIGTNIEIMISQDNFLETNPYEHYSHMMATDMESYAFVYTCNKLGIKPTIVKIVSDIVGENKPKDFIDSCESLSSKLETVLEDLIR